MQACVESSIVAPHSVSPRPGKPYMSWAALSGDVVIVIDVASQERQFLVSLAWNTAWPLTALEIQWDPEPAIAQMLPAIDALTARVWLAYQNARADYAHTARRWLDCHTRLGLYRDGWQQGADEEEMVDEKGAGVTEHGPICEAWLPDVAPR